MDIHALSANGINHTSSNIKVILSYCSANKMLI